VLGAPGGVQDGGNEIGERLADAGSRFDQKVPAPGQAVGDASGHRRLLGAGLVVVEDAGERTSGSEEGVEGGVRPGLSSGGMLRTQFITGYSERSFGICR